MEQSQNRGMMFRVVILWLAIFLLGSFWLTMRETSAPVSLAVIPEVPRQGEPIIAIFKLSNPSSHAVVTRYQLYANGQLVMGGTTSIAPESGKTYKYAYENPLGMGEQLNFVVRTESEREKYEKLLSSPPYPPQVWSSFVSFASFSTSVMSSMSTMVYYQSTFGSSMKFNVGVIISLVLMALLIFLELSQTVIEGRTTAMLGRLRLRFSTMTWILFVIFVGIVYTTVVMILAG